MGNKSREETEREINWTKNKGHSTDNSPNDILMLNLCSVNLKMWQLLKPFFGKYADSNDSDDDYDDDENDIKSFGINDSSPA